jgi:YggT family protein
VMSWFVSPYSRNPLADFLRRVTDPIVRPISNLLPATGGVDLSPIVAIFAIIIAQQVIGRIA